MILAHVAGIMSRPRSSLTATNQPRRSASGALGHAVAEPMTELASKPRRPSFEDEASRPKLMSVLRRTAGEGGRGGGRRGESCGGGHHTHACVRERDYTGP